MPPLKCRAILAGWILASAATARADVTLLLEEPYGAFGGMNPTGHSAVYLSRICAATPVSLRRCNPGEPGVVISRYHRIGGYDWVGIPLVPYLYAVDRTDEVPGSANAEEVASLREGYRRRHLESVAPDENDGSMPRGDWTQLVGEAYDRTIYTFGLATTEDQDDAFIRMFNSRPNRRHFNLLLHNCADFARQVIDFYYPGAVHRNFSADLGIMTPKQAARSLVRYAGKHRDLEFSTFVVAQVPGAMPRSSAVRGVLESLIRSKKYFLPLTTLALLHPALGGGLAYAFVEGSHFDPKRVTAAAGEFPSTPKIVVSELRASSGN